MPRRQRFAMGGYVYHILNRAVGRGTLSRNEGDYAAFERVLEEARHQIPIWVLWICIMPNHWHLVLWPEHDGDLSEDLRWLTVAHTQRWHAKHHTSGTGPLYQGRFKSFPVQDDEHLLTVCRYVERNALRANLTSRAEDWRGGSLWQRRQQIPSVTLADAWPVLRPGQWTVFVNQPETEAELEPFRRSVVRGTPFGEARWQQATAKNAGPGINPAWPGPSEEIPRVNGNANDTAPETTPDPNGTRIRMPYSSFSGSCTLFLRRKPVHARS